MRVSAWAATIGAMALLLVAVGIGTSRGVAQDAATPLASPVASPMASPAAGGGATMNVDMIDIDFVPTELTIPANTDVTVTLPNKGAAIHNFVIEELGIKSPDAQGGQTVSVTINAPAGTYPYICTQPGHKEAGMVGTLTVQ